MVPLVMVQKAKSKAKMNKSDLCHNTPEDLALLATPTSSKLKSITGARHVVQKAVYETQR